MAWITKNSGGAKIETRDEPYLTPAMRAEIDRLRPRYETTLALLLPSLHLVQQEYGWIPAQAMMEIAAHLALQPSDVIDTASFYEEYWLRPKGQHVIAVCRSIACEFCNHQAVTDAVRDSLGIEVGETTDDGMFTLIEIECLGSCDTAPVALIDHTLHERLTAESIVRLIESARHAGAHH